MLRDAGTGRLLCRGQEHGAASNTRQLIVGAIHGLAFSPAGSGRIVSSGEDKTLKLWNFTTESLVATRTMTGHEDAIQSVAFSPDGKRIASAGLDNTLRLWDKETGKEVATLLGHAGPVVSVAFSPIGEQIASGSEDKTLRLWDTVDDLDVLRLLRGHAGTTMRGVAFSPDSNRIASVGDTDGTVRIWNVAGGSALTGEELLTLRGHETTVWCVAFSPDGKTIASTSNDATLLWETGPPGRVYESRRNVEAARSNVDDRFAKLISSREVIESLRADTTIDEPVRQVALCIAKARGDNTYELSQDSWSVVNAVGDSPAAFARALREAEVAKEVKPDFWLYRSVPGVAQYRMARYDQAIQTLRRVEQTLHAQLGHTAHLTWQSLALHRPRSTTNLY